MNKSMDVEQVTVSGGNRHKTPQAQASKIFGMKRRAPQDTHNYDSATLDRIYKDYHQLHRTDKKLTKQLLERKEKEFKE